MIKVKRIYDEPSEEDGYRVLVDRVWPRGIKKDIAKVNLWSKDIAPTPSLRKWFSHIPERWEEFKIKYFEELKTKNELVDTIVKQSKGGTVTLLFGTKEVRYNNAVALKEFLDLKEKGEQSVKEHPSEGGDLQGSSESENKSVDSPTPV